MVASLRRMEALRQVDGWPCEHVAVGVAGAVDALYGDTELVFPWASVTKLASTVAVLVAAEEGIVDLDAPAGPPGSTIRHLLAHTSGLPFEGDTPIARPGERRIYSNSGFDVLAQAVAHPAPMPFPNYLASGWARAAIALAAPPSPAAPRRTARLLARAG